MQFALVVSLLLYFTTQGVRLKNRGKTKRRSETMGPLGQISVANYLELDYESFYDSIWSLGYRPPRAWKPLGAESSLVHVLYFLGQEVSDTQLIRLVESLKKAILDIRTNKQDKWTQYEVPLSGIIELIDEDEKRRASLCISARCKAAITTLACPGLPCNPTRATCKFGAHRVSKNLTTFSPPLMSFRVKGKTSSAGNQDWTDMFPELSKENVAKLAEIVGEDEGAEVVFELVDGFQKKGNRPITMKWFLKEAWTAKLDFFQVTSCSESGSPLMNWLKDTHARLGFSSILLEDDARKKCMQSNMHLGQESPLRLWYMLNAARPSEGKSFYESKGYLHRDYEVYQDSKKVFELKVADLRRLLDKSACRYNDVHRLVNAAKSLDKDIKNDDPDETVFQWLKRQNLAMQTGDAEACERLTFVSQLFWRNQWQLGLHEYKDPGLEALRLQVWDRLKVFTDHWKQQVFVAQL